MPLTYKDLTKQQFIVLAALAAGEGADVDGKEDVEFITELGRRYPGALIIGPPLRNKEPYPRVGVRVTIEGKLLVAAYEKDLKDRIEVERERRKRQGDAPQETSAALSVIKDKA